MSIYEKLTKIQSKLKAPKGQFNSFGKYSYRNCEDILEAVKPFLSEVGATLTISDKIINIGDRFYVEATARLFDTDQGEKLEVSAYAREDESKKGMDLSQVTGSTSSYARKYALNGLFCIDDTKDSDSTNHGKDETPPQAHTDTQPPKGTNTPSPQKTTTKVSADLKNDLLCAKCHKAITQAEATFSMSKFSGYKYCRSCQAIVKKEADNLK